MGAQDTYFAFCTVELYRDPVNATSTALDILTVSLSHRTYTAKSGKPYKKLQAKGRDGLIHLGSAFPQGTFGTGTMVPRTRIGIFYQSHRIDVTVPSHARATPASDLKVTFTLLEPSAAHPLPAPPPSGTSSMMRDPREDTLWNAVETMIRTVPVHSHSDIRRIRRALALLHHPDQVSPADRPMTTAILQRANDLLDRVQAAYAA